MPTMTIRGISEATHLALKARARRNGRSISAEALLILEEAVKPVLPKTGKRLKLGSELAAFGRRFGGIEFEPGFMNGQIEPAQFD